jgi:hypothetical protein
MTAIHHRRVLLVFLLLESSVGPVTKADQAREDENPDKHAV